MSSTIPQYASVNVKDYQWPTEAHNLARDGISSGDRMTVYRDLLRQALAGKTPQVFTSITAKRPANGGKRVPYVIGGMGRIASIKRWNATKPVERLKDALHEYHTVNDRNAPEASLAGSEIDQIAKLEDFRELKKADRILGNTEAETVVDIDSVLAAFAVAVSLPVVWTDMPRDEAELAAISDGEVRDDMTVSDRIKNYASLVKRPGWSKSRIARFFKLSNASITNYANYIAVRNFKLLSDVMDRLVRLHNGRTKPTKKLALTKFRELFKVMDGTNAKHKRPVPDSQGVYKGAIHFNPEEQEAILRYAFNSQVKRHNEAKAAKKVDGIADQERDEHGSPKWSDYILLRLRADDIEAGCRLVENHRTEAERKAQDDEAETQDESTPQNDAERQAQADAAASGEVEQPSSGEAKTQEQVNVNAIHPSGPQSHKSMLAFVDSVFWAETRTHAIVEPLRHFFYGHISADMAASRMVAATLDHKKKQHPKGLPTSISEAVAVSSTDQ